MMRELYHNEAFIFKKMTKRYEQTKEEDIKMSD